MDVGFDIKGQIDQKKLEAFLGPSTDILTGYTEGMPHAKREWNEDQLEILRRHAPEWIDKPAPDMVALAKKHTYGDSSTPARPFLEEGVELAKDELGPMAGVYFKTRVEGGNPTNILKAMGAMCVGGVKRFIRSDFYKREKPNSWLTIQVKSRSQKGTFKLSDKPLDDTGQMVNETLYVIRQGKNE